MIDNRELHVAGVAGDVTGVRAATSLCELVQLGKHTILQKQKPLLCVRLLLLSSTPLSIFRS